MATGEASPYTEPSPFTVCAAKEHEEAEKQPLPVSMPEQCGILAVG